MKTGLVMYPLPLGDERFAFVYLPTETTKADVDRIVAILRTIEPTQEEASAPCADGFHWAESMATSHRRCAKCGHEWVSTQTGSGNQEAPLHSDATNRSEAP